MDKQTSLERQFSGAVEPRADEQMLIVAGIEPPALLQYGNRSPRNPGRFSSSPGVEGKWP